jgi:very-short-patch-repair endonuclease
VVRPDGRRAFIDVAYPEPLVAIEADGWECHGQRAAFDADRVRSNELVLLGWRVLHVTSAMTDAQICRVVAIAIGR